LFGLVSQGGAFAKMFHAARKKKKKKEGGKGEKKRGKKKKKYFLADWGRMRVPESQLFQSLRESVASTFNHQN